MCHRQGSLRENQALQLPSAPQNNIFNISKLNVFGFTAYSVTLQVQSLCPQPQLQPLQADSFSEKALINPPFTQPTQHPTADRHS